MLALFDSFSEAYIYSSGYASGSLSEKEKDEAEHESRIIEEKFRNLFDSFSEDEQNKLKKYILENAKKPGQKIILNLFLIVII